MADKVEILLEYSGKRLTFPINPSELAVDIDSSSESLTVIGLGEVSIPKTPKLATLKIESFFWNKIEAAVVETVRPDECVTWIKEWQTSKKPAMLVVKGLAHFTMRVTCEKFRHEKRAGEEGATYFELSLKEYRDYGAQRIDVNQDDFVLAIYQQTPSVIDNREVETEQVVSDPKMNTNPTAVGNATGTEPMDVYTMNMDAYDTAIGEFMDGRTIVIPSLTNMPSSTNVNLFQMTANDFRNKMSSLRGNRSW